MTTMNISLPDGLKSFVDEQVSARNFGTSSEYVRELIRKDQDRLQLRGMLLKGDDAVISLSILHRVGATPEEREEYLRYAAWKPEKDGEMVDQARFELLAGSEQFILTVTETGFGKRSSAYEYRRTGRGGQGLTAHGLGGRAGTRLAAAFPVEETDDLLLVTSGGQMIRTRIDQVRIVGRSSQGVTIFRTGKDEKVVSVERLPDSGGADEADVADEGGETEA